MDTQTPPVAPLDLAPCSPLREIDRKILELAARSGDREMQLAWLRGHRREVLALLGEIDAEIQKLSSSGENREVSTANASQGAPEMGRDDARREAVCESPDEDHSLANDGGEPHGQPEKL